MGASGRISLSVTSTNHISGWIDWQESDISKADNTSRVTARLCYNNSGSDDTYSDVSTFYLTVNGQTVRKTDGAYMRPGGTYEVLTLSVTVLHNDDGSKSIVIEGGGALKSTRGLSASSGSGTTELTTIDRYPTAPTTFTAADGNSIDSYFPGDTVSLSWSGATGNITGYEWQARTMSPDGGTWSSWSSSRTVSGTSGTDAWDQKSGTLVQYRVRALNGTLPSGWTESNVLTVRGGALIRVGGAWKRGTVYIKIGGTWRRARRVCVRSGVWKDAL